MRVCIVGASGKLGQYMVQHALDRDYEVVGVCREQSVEKLDAFKERITVVPGATDDRDVIRQAVAGCDGVLVVLVPRGVHGYSTGTAQAVLDHAPPRARLVFSSGWHITRDGQDMYTWKLRLFVKVVTPLARLVRFADLDDQVEACRRVFASDTRWTVVRGSDLEEGESQGLPVWSRHVGDPILESNLTRRIDFALFMVDALTTMIWSARPRRSSAARRPRHSRTLPESTRVGQPSDRAFVYRFGRPAVAPNSGSSEPLLLYARTRRGPDRAGARNRAVPSEHADPGRPLQEVAGEMVRS